MSTISWAQDLAFDEFRRQIETIKAATGTNEATTRIRAIDTLLFDVLRWPRTAVETEKYCRQEGFSDYAFLQDTSICLIIEAKKSDTYFLLPNCKVPAQPIGFGLLAKQCPAAEAALIQALQYASLEGARYVGITNGHQWILALAFVPNQPVSQRSVIVFESLQAIESRFSFFYETFGVDAILGNAPSRLLLESRKAPAPPKLAHKITNYPVPANRNVITNELTAVLSLMWEEFAAGEASEQFLRECYVRPEQGDDELVLAAALLRDRVADEQIPVPQRVQGIATLVKQQSAPKPIVVLGRVGHGKSTFLRYLRLVEAKSTLSKYIQIDIDFIDRPDGPNEVGRYVYDSVVRQLLERYGIDTQSDGVARSALRPDLSRFKKSPLGKLYAESSDEYRRAECDEIVSKMANRHEYLAKVMEDLRKSRGSAIALFFDNLDRRLQTIQDEAFLKASAIARDWNAVVFVCLRPDTFFHSKEKGVLDSLAPSVVSVAAPLTAIMLKKRFAFARRIADGDPVVRSSAVWKDASISVQLPSTSAFLECCERSFYKRRELTELFEAASNGDMRDVLRLVRQVLTSQHLNTGKILEKIRGGSYTLSEHEAMRALLFGDFRHFDPRICIFTNLFDIKRADPQEQFSRVLALSYLAGMNDGGPDYGFIQLEQLISFLCQIGFSQDHVGETCESLYSRECIEGRIPGVPWSETYGVIRITPRGRYHVNRLVRTFEYVDAVVVDTPIVDERARQNIVDDSSVRDRLNRAQCFTSYLRQCMNFIQDAVAQTTIKGILDDIETDLFDVRTRVDKAEERY